MNYADMVPRVISEVLGAPEFVVEEHVKDVAIDFCRRSMVWRHIAQVNIISGDDAYRVTLPIGVVDRIMSLKKGNGQPLAPSASLPAGLEDFNEEGTTGEPKYYRERSAGEITVYPVPAADLTLYAECVASPDRDSSELDDSLYLPWGDAIIYGAKGRLLTLPKVDWRDPQKGSYYLRLFDQALVEARIIGSNGYGTASQRIQMRPW